MMSSTSSPLLDRLALAMATRAKVPDYREPQSPFDSPSVYEDLGLHDEVAVDVHLETPVAHSRPAHDAIRFTFPSRVHTEWDACNVVTGELYLLPSREPAPVVVLVHGNGSRSPAYERYRARKLLAAGCHAVRLSYAHHHDRVPVGERTAGHTLSPDLHGCVQTWVQAAADGADLVRWLRRQPFTETVGMTGWSGGGLTTMLTMTLVALDFAMPVVPATDMSVPLWRGPGHDQVRRHAGSIERVAEMVSAIRPELRTPVIPDRFLLLPAARDHISGVAATERTWRAWGKPPIEWLPGGHMGSIMHLSLGNRILALATDSRRQPSTR